MDERQIQRYGRQILLREVGGRGQRALLAAGVAVRGTSPALAVAVDYLAAGGSPVLAHALPPPAFALDGLPAFNEDAVGTVPPALELVEAGAPTTQLPAVAVGKAGLVWASAAACPACFAATSAALAGAGPTGADSVTLGSAAALAAQRLILGLPLEAPLGALALADGQLKEAPVARCPAHE